MDKSTIGKIQIWFGCIIILITIVGSIILVNLNLKAYNTNGEATISSWMNVMKEQKETNNLEYNISISHIRSYERINTTIIETAGSIFVLNLLILLVLSIILITQGLVNIKQ
jgi:cell division protein FtsL